MHLRTSDMFKSDAAEMLEWLYGVNARLIFIDSINHGDERVGQAFMNAVRHFDHEGYQRILGAVGDPFYDDLKIPLALDILTRK